METIKLTCGNIDAILEAKGFMVNDAVSSKTFKKLEIRDFGSTDFSYRMLPDRTIIKCYLISHDGKYVKKDGTPGKVLTLARIMDQRCFYSDILYAVEVIEEGSNQDKNLFYSTRASDITYPIQDTPE